MCQDGFSGTLTILVLTSFSIALTSSAALGTSAELCREAISTEDYMTAGGQEERDVSRTEEEVLGTARLSSFGLGRREAKKRSVYLTPEHAKHFTSQVKRRNKILRFCFEKTVSTFMTIIIVPR